MHLFNNIKYLIKTIFRYNRLNEELGFTSVKDLLLNDKTLNEKQYENFYNIIVKGGSEYIYGMNNDLYSTDYINAMDYINKFINVFWKYGLTLEVDDPIKIYNAFKKEYV